MSIMKELKPINDFLNSWLKKNHFDCSVEFDTDFSFDCMNDIIHYSIVVVQEHDKLFLEVCKKVCPEIIESDNFILSFFHELGHYMTQDEFSEKEWEKYDKFCDKISSIESPTQKDYFRYYNHKIEIAATEWGCNYIVNHSRKVKNWWSKLKPLILNFIEENNIEVDESEI